MDSIDKYQFMEMVKDILETVPAALIETRANEMKRVIDEIVKMELNFAKAGIR